MSRMLGSFLVLLLPIQIFGAEPPEQGEAAADPASSIEKLAASLDRLVVLLEKEAAFRAQDREARRVEIAVGILGLASRKIDRLEAEIEQVTREQEKFTKQIGLLKTELEQLGEQALAESGQLSKARKGEIAVVEQRISSDEAHIARLLERQLALENDVTAERRRFATVEGVVKAWMEAQ